MSESFHDRLKEAIERAGAPICLGLDPDPKLIPEHLGSGPDACLLFLTEIIAATRDLVVAYKPNTAFFEIYGSTGWAMLERIRDWTGPDPILIMDGKRGDIDHSNHAYAEAMFGKLGADAVTVQPYLGGGALTPFMQSPEKGMFVLCVTSNPGAEAVQNLTVDKVPLYQEIARQAKNWSAYDNVGLVVGTTKPAALKEVLKIAPELPYLLPGSGTQGGSPKLIDELRKEEATGLLTFSRSILFASDGKDFAQAARVELLRLREELGS